MSDIETLNKQLDQVEALCPDFSLDVYLSFFHDDAVIFSARTGAGRRGGGHPEVSERVQ